MNGSGTATIKVDIVEAEIEFASEGFDSVYLRNNEGVLEYSNDHTTWTPVGSGGNGGAGDMTKAVYDVSNNGYVDAAGSLKNGNETLTYGNVFSAYETSESFQFTGGTVCWIGTTSQAPITLKNETGALKVSLDNGSTWNIVTITPEV
jgi:hypothetical protein